MIDSEEKEKLESEAGDGSVGYVVSITSRKIYHLYE